jgi:hypothetical protein
MIWLAPSPGSPADREGFSVKLDGKAAQSLRLLFEGGADQAAQRLGTISSATWNISHITTGPEAVDALWTSAPEGGEEHWGNWLEVPGGGFLVIFPSKSGALVTNRFTSAGADAVDALPERESQVLAEVSNIILNAMTDDMAAACGQVLMLSSPERIAGPKREILRRVMERFTQAAAPAWTFHARLSSPTFRSGCDVVVFLEPDVASRLASGRKS